MGGGAACAQAGSFHQGTRYTEAISGGTSSPAAITWPSFDRVLTISTATNAATATITNGASLLARPPCSSGRSIGRLPRSEERRVGKECRSRWSQCHEKKRRRRMRWWHGEEVR